MVRAASELTPIIGVGFLRTGRRDRLQHAFKVAEHLLIAEADDPVVMLLELSGPSCVALGVPVMDAAINLHDQAAFRTAKVSHERTQGMLSPKLVPTQLPVSQALPQQPLGRGHPLAKYPRTLLNGP